MKRPFRNGLAMMLLLVMLAANVAQGPQSTPTSDESSITVHGVRDRDRKIGQFIKELTPAPVGGQISRFEAPVCPVVLGVPPANEQFIAGRLRKIAAAAGMRVARADCEANVVVIFAQSKRGVLEQFLRHRPEYLPLGWGRGRVKSLQEDPSPVIAWQFEGQFWADGRPIASSNDGRDSFDLSRAQRTIEPGSRLKPSARRAFTTSVVVMEKDALDGLTLTQLADYAAMRSFVRTDPSRLRSAGADTILSIVDAPMGSAVPLTMTRWDFSFLKALYASRKNEYASFQRSEIGRLMRRDLERGDAAAR